MPEDPSDPEPWLAYGRILLDGGEPEAARVILEKGLLLPETGQNPVAPVNGFILLAACHSRLMRFDDAEAAYDRALHLADKTLDPEHILRVTLICNWAVLERSRGALEHETQLWLLALPVLQRDPQFAGLLAECQRSLQELGTLGPEERRLRESFELSRAGDLSGDKRFGERVASFHAVQRNAGELTTLLGKMRRHRERNVALRDGLIMRPEEIWRKLTATGSSGRQPVLDEQRCRLNLFLAKTFQDTPPAAAQSALETLLWRRGIGLEIQRSANRLARRDAEVRETLDTLRSNRSGYAAMLFEAPSDAALRPAGSTKMVLEPIEQSFDYQSLERRLLDRLEPQINRFVSRPADCAELASRVPSDALLIEYWRCTWPVDEGPIVAAYVALVLPENRPDRASIIPLCECAAVEDTLLDYLSLLSGRSKSADSANVDDVKRDPVRARELGHTLRTLLLDPLQPWTSRAKHLLLVTDGLLDRLPFSTLPVDDAGYVMDRWLLSYLHTARDLFGADDAPGAPGSPIVFSNPAYDWPGLFGEGTFRFDQLEWAAQEGQAIGALLGVTPITDTQATKSALTACRSPEILHLATHGMLLPARQDIAELGRINSLVWRDPGELRFQIAGLAVFTQGLGRLSDRQLPDQALRSVLAVAGVNSWLDGYPIPETAGNGLANAEDIAALDLAANKLTVLSACETGLGVIGIGEGVLGLRSSFMIAGAETVVTSLWSVDDKSTNELMCAFYQNLIERKMGRAEALQEAQQAIRRQYPDDPYYWGPFVLQGAIEPLRQ